MAEQHSPNDQRIRQIVREEIQANNAVIMEAMRDMQTELLRGMERFARGISRDCTGWRAPTTT